jgi:hypothetical protein
MAAGKHVSTGILLIVVGIVFILIALLRPGFLWDMGKVRAGRDVVGDTGVAVFFCILGAAMGVVGLVLARRK